MFCPHCGHQTPAQNDSTVNFCPACGAPSSAPARPRLFRPLHPRMIAGVCSGIAMHFGWDTALLRIVLVVIAFCTSGCAVLFYIAAWILIPEAVYAVPGTPPYTRATA